MEPVDQQLSDKNKAVDNKSENINLMTSVSSPFEREMIRKYPQLHGLIRKVELKEDDEEKLSAFVHQIREISFLVRHEQRAWRLKAEQQRYADSAEINFAYFEKNNINDKIQQNMKKLSIENKSISNLVKDICNKQLKLNIMKSICDIIEMYTRNDEQLNIIRMDVKELTNEIMNGILSDKYWVKNNLLEKNTFNIFESLFTNFIDKRQFRNFYDASSFCGKRRLTNRKLKCGDIIQIVNDTLHAGFSTMFFVIDTDNKTMIKIGINGFGESNVNIILPFHVTRTLYDPMKLYSRLWEVDFKYEMDIEFQLVKSQSYSATNIDLVDVRTVNHEYISLIIHKNTCQKRL
eukprot:515891_1